MPSRRFRDLAKSARGSSAVRELLGLTYYRLGRWKEALAELREFSELTASVDQYPVMADCERALGHHAAVEELFAELRRAGGRQRCPRRGPSCDGRFAG